MALPPPPKRTSTQSSPQRPKQEQLDEMSGSVMVNTPGGTVRRSMRSRTFDDPANIISSPSTLVRRPRGAVPTSTTTTTTASTTTSRRHTDSPSQEKKKQSNNPLMTPIQPMSKIAQQLSNTASLSPPSPTNRRNYTKKATPSTLRSSRLRENPPMYPALSNSFYDYQETQSFYDYDHADVDNHVDDVDVDDDDYYSQSGPPFKEEKKKSFFDRLIGSSSVKDNDQQQQQQQQQRHFERQQQHKAPSYFARIRKVILALGVIVFVIVTLTFNFQLISSSFSSSSTTSKETINEQQKRATVNIEEGKFVELDVAIKMTREMILREKEDFKEGERVLKEKIEQILEKYSALESDYEKKFERFSSEIPSLSDSVEALSRRIDQFQRDKNISSPPPSMQVEQPDFASDIQSLKSLSSSLKEDILKLKQKKDTLNDVSKDHQTSPLTLEEEFYIDFASPSLGTRVVVGSTSKSFKPKTAPTFTPDYSLSSWIKGLLFGGGGGQYMTQQQQLFTATTSSSLSPYLALSPDLTPGNCWSFNGRQGQITLSLGQEIIPTHFTIEHVDPRYLGPNGPIDRTSAPRLLSVWALFKLPSSKDGNGDSKHTSSDDDNDEHDDDDLSTSPPPPPIKIADFTFSPGQIKKTVSSKIILGEPVRLLQLRIEDNHGKRDYTCLYRWKVHSIHSDESLPFEQDLQ